MRVMVTNDDGVHAVGLHVLARALADAGHDVFVAAPLREQSGSSAAIGTLLAGQDIAYEQFALEALDGLPVFGVDGPPALAVLVARLGAFGPEPDVVVAGINPGNNTGRAVLHSGTVGAALTAANFGISGLAVSQATAAQGTEPEWQPATAAALAVEALAWLVEAPRRTVLNLNLPNVAPGALKGVRTARLAPFGTVRSVLAAQGQGRLQVELRATEEPLAPDTDTMLVLAGYAAVTALVGVRAADETGAAAALDAALTRS